MNQVRIFGFIIPIIIIVIISIVPLPGVLLVALAIIATILAGIPLYNALNKNRKDS